MTLTPTNACATLPGSAEKAGRRGESRQVENRPSLKRGESALVDLSPPPVSHELAGSPFYKGGFFMPDDLDRDTAAKLIKVSLRKGKAIILYDLFWRACQSSDCSLGECKTRKRCLGGCKSKDKKMQILRAFEQFSRKECSKGWRHKRRKTFTAGTSIGYEILDRYPCFSCGETPHHRHHIIQLQHGGGNHARNIVPLCRTCHRKVHSKKH